MEISNTELAKIKKLRQKLNLTQKQLAKISGVSQSLIAKIESGRIDPAYSKVKQIQEALENELNRQEVKKKAIDLMSARIISVAPDDKLNRVLNIMKKNDVSQLPVFDGPQCVGSLSDSMLVEWLSKYGPNISKVVVGVAMTESFPTVPPNSHVDAIAGLLKYYKAVLVKKEGKIVGIITKADLIKAMHK